MIKTFVEQVLEICGELNIDNDDIVIRYDENQNATIEIRAMYTYSFIEICERDFDENVMFACDATKLFTVYRNDNCIFVGNDMYDKMFFELLKTLLKTCVG